MEEKTKKPKVLFAYVSAGMGHVSPADGIADAFEEKYGDKCEIVRSYVFRDTESENVKNLGKIQENHPKNLGQSKILRKLEGISYFLPSKLVLWVLDRSFGKGRRDFIEDLKKRNADMVVSTYYLPSHLARQANEKGCTDSIVVTYIPDPYVYPAWDRKCDRLFVNNDKALRLALKKGFKKEQVKLTAPAFRKSIVEGKIDRQTARERLNVSKDAYVILYTAGAYGTKGAEKLIAKIMQSDINAELIVVCGKNQKTFDEVSRLKDKGTGSVKLTVLGFVDNVNEYMCASNVVIGKAGSNTVMEANFYNLPLIISSESSKLEIETAKYAVNKKTAVRIKNNNKIVEVIKKDKENGYLKNMLTGVGKVPSDGAESIADALYEMIKKKFPQF